ncbi:pyridoxamine 5'-phosphate oxidase family protein [Nonomuraea sp. NBC_01738]|uniref:pyridoxamine 5'-phosphate oxidase family protein n=1 Tax=Nonomuraea sp. NBC_01738 TaxID=2976003 RepID=UPI002E12B15D|nr:pyridoxamine 5'-phosphate oxidase family protein [Nonomuraea sp. NBC_01738]
MGLPQADREAFLAEELIGALAVEGERGRAPLNVPVWYDYSPGGVVSFLTDADSVKARLIGKAGRFSLLAQRSSPTYRYVSVEGPVVAQNPTTPDEMTRIAARYLPADAVAGYVAQSNLPVLVTFHMRPEHWLSADLGSI